MRGILIAGKPVDKFGRGVNTKRAMLLAFY